MRAPNPSEIPTKPGSYQFYSPHNEVLYVGKAKNLRSRIMSYFREGPKSNVRIDQMVEIADRVEWITVNSETESLLLEYSLIKEHMPRYNVMLKDDRSYPWLAVTLSETWPKAGVFRGKQKRGVKYFGPYTSAWLIRQTLDLLTTIYPVRTCSPAKFADYKRRGRGCLLHDVGKCSAPCIDAVSEDQYREYVKGLMGFLNGDTKEVVALVKQAMQEASDQQQFERAANLRDRLNGFEEIVEKQEIYGSVRDNFDVVACVTDNIEICVEVFRVRQGRLLGNRRFILQPQITTEDNSVISQVLLRLYEDQIDEVIPSTVLVSELPEDVESHEKLLAQQRGDKVKLRYPEKGSKKRLMDLARENAQDHLARRARTRINDIDQRTKALSDLRDQLKLSRVPLRIECFDISHIQGTNTVASMVVLDDGLPKKSEYRHFTIKHNEGNDDFLSMEEAITRRFGAHLAHNDKFAVLPDLLLIDGGKGQLSAAMRALKSLGLEDACEVASLAKRYEEVFRPGESEPHIIPAGSLSLMLLQVVRDEAHRFAITHHRKKRSDTMTRSILDDIAGLGPARKKRLLQSFGSVKELKLQSRETLQSLTYLPDNVANDVYDALHEEGNK
jgi:excinuclease ABC subunit C